jgi:hypothetical protein
MAMERKTTAMISKARRDYKARGLLADQIECVLPCEKQDCHHYERTGLSDDPEDECENMSCPWRPFLMAYLNWKKEKRP